MKNFIYSIMATLLCFVESAWAQDPADDLILDIHPEYLEKVSEARQLGLDAVNSQMFVNDLQRFYDAYNHTDKISTWSDFGQNYLDRYNQAWAKVIIEQTVNELRVSSPTLSIKSKGGIYQWGRYKFAGNIADEAVNGDPIILNKHALSKRAKSSIGGSIIHEGAHKIGLRHDNYPSFKRLGKCEPPYVINQIIERIIEGDSWVFDQYDCELLSDWTYPSSAPN